MIKIVVLGTGNVAYHFIKAFAQTENAEVVQVYNHDIESLKYYTEYATTTSISDILKADLYLICIKDDKVLNVANSIPFNENSIVAHVSGSVPLLKTKHRDAVFYPLQTFSKDKDVSFSQLPLCIETEFPSDYDKLSLLAESLGSKVYNVNSQQRQELHLAAVFVCNFVNHLYHIGDDICSRKELPFDILKPLIKETAEKIFTKKPLEAQTGPAKRSDETTIQRHLEQLNRSQYKDLYRYLTTSIQNLYESKKL